jgi:type III secretion protein Q
VAQPLKTLLSMASRSPTAATEIRRIRGPAPQRARLTRAHLALERRPSFRAETIAALGSICHAFEQQLGCTAVAKARLLPMEVLPPRALSETTSFAVVELSARGVRALIEVERVLLAGILDRLSGGAGRPGPAVRLSRVEEAGFGYLCLVALRALRGTESLERRFAPRLLGVVDRRTEALARMESRQPHVCVELQWVIGESTGSARVLLPAPALHAAIADLPVQPSTGLAPAVSAAGFAAVPLMGRTSLDMGQWASLTSGDVVIFADVAISEGALLGPSRLVSRGFDIFGRFTAEGFAFTRADLRANTEEKPVAAPTTQDMTVTSLPVDVEIELTRLRLTLGELSSLKPGALLPLRISSSEPVYLRVGDRRVARAELVEIENEVGARILDLLPES